MSAGRFLVQLGDDERVVDVMADGRVTIGDSDQPMTVSPAGGCQYEVTSEETSRRVWIAGPPEAREVFVDGRVYRFEVTSAGARRRKPAAAHGDSMTAPMPGTVIKVMVAPGQSVKRGDTLLKLEAMKMELPIRAPHDGIVKTVHCSEGDLVQPGVVLLDLK